MLKFILIVIVLMLLFRALRKFIFFSAHNAFNQAAQDFMKRQEAQDRQRKEEGRVYVDTKARINPNDKFDDYEEVK
ncbi:MAG: hypothetical protein IPP27_10365 [Bacteroidetes bacterium]|nr:hypothetical protein [Bacteroidota bacterium]MBK9413393.1 hypothetical protein [Bacteroidota bacterium]MBL0032552.1 hypothetical protein [Bacteroidota bacterium]MBP6428235.1 hypothetical protein [Bacteroidia bacterium]MBP6656926.1 hypothetical protein [Bacteroidia bacterium]